MNLEAYGFLPDEMPVDAQGIPARITAVHKERYALVCQYEYFAGSQEFPTTGDFVLINFNPGGDSQIIRTLPRRTFFSRKNPTLGRGEQAVAANFDYVFIMQSLNQNFNVKRLERYLTLAWQSGAAPVIVLTKSDLAKDYGGYLKAARDVAKGVPVHAVSSRTGEGMESLAHYTKPGKTLVLLGSSGVGKSSLVNALAGPYHHPPPADPAEMQSHAHRHAGHERAWHVECLRRAGRGILRCGAVSWTLPIWKLPPPERTRLRHPPGHRIRRTAP